jgi:hypothetical protein
MLEALLQDLPCSMSSTASRPGLFRLFTQIWNSVALNDDADIATCRCRRSAGCRTYHPLPRQDLPACCRWKVSEEEVAYILGIDVAETRKLADTAGREMAAEIATDVLIIEDETFIAMDLESPERETSATTCGVARTHRRGGAGQEQEARPDPGRHPACRRLLRPDAVNDLLRVFEVPVVFITTPIPNA